MTGKHAVCCAGHLRVVGCVQGGGEKQVPVTYVLQQHNQAKSVHKLPDEERAILSAGEIARMKESKHELAREEQRKRREYMKMREEEARSPEPIVPTLAPDPPLPPVFDALQDTYRYRYNENQAGWIVRPFVDSNGPDRSDGINGGQAERHGTLRLPSQFIGGAPSRVLFQVCSCVWTVCMCSVLAHLSLLQLCAVVQIPEQKVCCAVLCYSRHAERCSWWCSR